MSISISYERGFKLVEIVIIIAIIALLASVVVANMQEARKKTRDAQRISDIGQLQVALRLYKDANGTYPDYPSGSLIDGQLNYSGNLPVSDIDADLTGYLTGVIKDSMGGDPNTGFEYVYDSDHDGCTVAGVGANKKLLYAKRMERSGSSNWATVCGGTSPGINTYVIILQ